MSCLISKGRLLPCKDKVGGLYKVWFANFGEIAVTVDTISGLTHLSGATNMIAVAGKAAELYEFELKGTSNFSQEMVSSSENGVTSVTQTLTLDLQGGDNETNNTIKLLAYGRPHIFVQDNFGSVWLLGRFRGMDLTSGIFTSGAAITDKYGYTLTLVGVENEYANFVYGSQITSPFGGLDATSAYDINYGS